MLPCSLLRLTARRIFQAHPTGLDMSGTRSQSIERDAFMASVDALFPYHVHRGTLGHHTSRNVVATACWINMCKSTFLPGTLMLRCDLAACQKRRRVRSVDD